MPGVSDLVLVDNSSRAETMLTCSPEVLTPRFHFQDYGLRLYSLTPERLRILRFLRFPADEEPRLANHVLRPTLWRPSHIGDFASF